MQKIRKITIADIDWDMFEVGEKVKLIGQITAYDGSEMTILLPEAEEEMAVTVKPEDHSEELGDRINDWDDGQFEIIAVINETQDGLEFVSLAEYEE